MTLKRVIFRSRTKNVLVLASLLSLLCLFNVIFPAPNSVSEQHQLVLRETESIVLSTNHRREYYVLNQEFFPFLARTSMECLIQVEPAEEWDRQALVRTKLLDSGSSSAEVDKGEADENERQENALIAPAKLWETPRKYILVYRHFEQLGKTMENLFQLVDVANKHWQRYIVQPNIQNSRLSSESTAYPLETYLNVSRMNELLFERGYQKFIPEEDFLRDCNHTGTADVKTTVVHFLYNDYFRGNTRKWYNLKPTELQDILKRTASSGWTGCPFINKHLGIVEHFRGLVIGREVCVDPEVIVNKSVFQKEVLGDDKCVIFVQWRGFGSKRTHFVPSFDQPSFGARELTHMIPASDLIMREVREFKNSKLPANYIAVHLRTERLLGSFKKLRLCIDHVVYLVRILRELRGSSAVFLATDMTHRGSDAFVRRDFYTWNATGRYRVRREDLTRFHEDAVRRLKPVTYEPSRTPFSVDKGLVSLVEMNILKGGLDLVTIGSGSFRAWLVSVFREHQNRLGRRGFTVSQICNDGNA